MPPFAFAGHDFRIAGRTALYWPSARALVVADLHLEKASWFAAHGQMLPPYDSHATLTALGALLAETGATTIWCLGDNFHDEAGPARLNGEARALLRQMTAAADWFWITGNHDEVLPQDIGGTILEEAAYGGLILRHRADPLELRPELSGHWHPKHRVVARGKAVSRACFVRSGTKLILPAFGAFTGGMAANDPAILACTGRDTEALVPAGGRTLRFAIS
jgi:DNA ligase-associated metallophosphoesterase